MGHCVIPVLSMLSSPEATRQKRFMQLWTRNAIRKQTEETDSEKAVPSWTVPELGGKCIAWKTTWLVPLANFLTCVPRFYEQWPELTEGGPNPLASHHGVPSGRSTWLNSSDISAEGRKWCSHCSINHVMVSRDHLMLAKWNRPGLILLCLGRALKKLELGPVFYWPKKTVCPSQLMTVCLD